MELIDDVAYLVLAATSGPHVLVHVLKVELKKLLSPFEIVYTVVQKIGIVCLDTLHTNIANITLHAFITLHIGRLYRSLES